MKQAGGVLGHSEGLGGPGRSGDRSHVLEGAEHSAVEAFPGSFEIPTSEALPEAVLACSRSPEEVGVVETVASPVSLRRQRPASLVPKRRTATFRVSN